MTCVVHCLLQWRDTEAAAAEYSQMVRCHDDAARSSVTDVAAKSTASTDATSVCANVHGFGRRFSSPARTAFHVTGHHKAAEALPGLGLIYIGIEFTKRLLLPLRALPR